MPKPNESEAAGAPAKDEATLAAEREAREARKAKRALHNPLADWTFDAGRLTATREFPSETPDEASKLAKRVLSLAGKLKQSFELAYDGQTRVGLRLPTENGKLSKAARSLARRAQRPPKGKGDSDAEAAEATAEG